MAAKISSFTDLLAWQQARKLTLEIYQTTNSFPQKEIYGLTNQMRRAVISISSNIAEGFTRRSGGDKSHFYTIAKGSLTELQSQLIIARDVGYLKEEDFRKIIPAMTSCGKFLTGLIRSTNK